jgi:hypothetical protein
MFVSWAKKASPNGLLFRGTGDSLILCGVASPMRNGLTTVMIPSNVSRISVKCFAGCHVLYQITFECGSVLRAIEASSFLETKVRMIQIPASVEFIGRKCFAGCPLREVTFESGSKLQRIGEFAFADTRLTVVAIPANVECIGKNCFNLCTSLSILEFDSESSLKEIEDYAFLHSHLKRIEIPKKCERMSGLSLIGVKEVSVCKGNAFFVEDEPFIKSYDKKVLIRYLKKDSKIVIDREIEEISRGCFHGCKFISVAEFESGSQLRCIEESAFAETGLKKIEIPSSVEFIGKNCFSGSMFTVSRLCVLEFQAGSKLRRIEEFAFYESDIRKVRIPSSVEFIGKYCFADCKYLCVLEFEPGSQLRRVEKCAFSKTGLKKIEFPASAEFIEED